MLVKSLVKAAFRGEPLFRPSRPDFIETSTPTPTPYTCSALFRPSRPDFIETSSAATFFTRTGRLFRPSRPDFIETCNVPWDAEYNNVIVPAF